MMWMTENLLLDSVVGPTVVEIENCVALHSELGIAGRHLDCTSKLDSNVMSSYLIVFFLQKYESMSPRRIPKREAEAPSV